MRCAREHLHSLGTQEQELGSVAAGLHAADAADAAVGEVSSQHLTDGHHLHQGRWVKDFNPPMCMGRGVAEVMIGLPAGVTRFENGGPRPMVQGIERLCSSLRIQAHHTRKHSTGESNREVLKICVIPKRFLPRLHSTSARFQQFTWHPNVADAGSNAQTLRNHDLTLASAPLPVRWA